MDYFKGSISEKWRISFNSRQRRGDARAANFIARANVCHS